MHDENVDKIHRVLFEFFCETLLYSCIRISLLRVHDFPLLKIIESRQESDTTGPHLRSDGR